MPAFWLGVVPGSVVVLFCTSMRDDAKQHHFYLSPVYTGLHGDGYGLVRICTGMILAIFFLAGG